MKKNRYYIDINYYDVASKSYKFKARHYFRYQTDAVNWLLGFNAANDVRYIDDGLRPMYTTTDINPIN